MWMYILKVFSVYSSFKLQSKSNFVLLVRSVCSFFCKREHLADSVIASLLDQSSISGSCSRVCDLGWISQLITSSIARDAITHFQCITCNICCYITLAKNSVFTPFFCICKGSGIVVLLLKSLASVRIFEIHLFVLSKKTVISWNIITI